MGVRIRSIRNLQFLLLAWIGALHIFPAIQVRWAYANPPEAANLTTSNTSISDSFGWSSGGPYGGYVYHVATGGSAANLLVAGTDDGVYMSFDGGQFWSAAGLSRQRVPVVGVNPQNPNIIYAGTDGGIQKSVNGGASWIPIGPFESPSGQAHRILDLVICSQNPLIIYAVTWIGESLGNYNNVFCLVKSTNGGSSWQTKFTKQNGEEILSILIDADDPNRLYLGVSEWDIGLYLSPDGGDTWHEKRMPSESTSFQEVVALAMTSAGSNPARIYAIERDNGVFSSINRGETWTNAGASSINMNGPWALTVDPVNSQTVYVGTRSWNSHGQYYDGLLHKSVNGGDTWVTHTLPGLATGFAFTSNHQLCASFDNGVQKSLDLGETWQRSDQGIAITPIAGLAVDPLSNRVYAVINEQSDEYLAKYNSYPVAVSADQGSSWTYLNQGPRNLGAIAVAQGSPSIIWTGDGFKTSASFYVHKSADGGNSWDWIKFLQITGGGQVKYGASDILVNSMNPQCLLFGFQHIIGYGILARTTNGGITWSELGESTSALAADPNDSTLVYTGRSMMGGVWAISNACGNWQSNMIDSDSQIGNVSDIEVGSDSKVYVAASDGLWRWDKSNWLKLPGPPNGTPTALTIDRESMPETLYVGTSEEGVYSSPDGGLTWTSLNNGLGDLRIKKLTLSAGVNKRLYAGTAAGVWRTNLGGEVPPSPSVSASDGLYTNIIRISWTVVPTVTRYELYRSTGLTAQKAKIMDALTTTFDDTTASPGTAYHYWVKACNGGGCSAFSAPDEGYMKTLGSLPAILELLFD